MCHECKPPYKIWIYTVCIARGLSLHVCLFYFLFVCLIFWHTSCSRSGTESTTRELLLLLLFIHLHWNIDISSIRALTGRELEVSDDLSHYSSIFDYSRLLMLLQWLRFMLNSNDCLKKPPQTSNNGAYCRYNSPLNTCKQWLSNCCNRKQITFEFKDLSFGCYLGKLPTELCRKWHINASSSAAEEVISPAITSASQILFTLGWLAGAQDKVWMLNVGWQMHPPAWR